MSPDFKTTRQVEEITGIKKTTLFKYENEFNLKIRRDDNNIRQYSDENVEILLQIKNLRDEGFSIENIRKKLNNTKEILALQEQTIKEVDIKSLSADELKSVLIDTFKESLEIAITDSFSEMRKEIQELKEQNTKLLEQMENLESKKKGFFSFFRK